MILMSTLSLSANRQPLPQEEEEVKKPESVLRESETAKEEIYPQDPSLIEVQRMTYTSEKFWDKE